MNVLSSSPIPTFRVSLNTQFIGKAGADRLSKENTWTPTTIGFD
jgi:hypothetical protein